MQLEKSTRETLAKVRGIVLPWSLLLCVHSRFDVFPLSLPSPLYQGHTHTHPAIVSVVNFQTARKITSYLSVLAEQPD